VQEAKLRAGEIPVGDDWGTEPDTMHGLLHTEINGKIIREVYPSLKGNYGDYYRSVYETITSGKPVSEKPEHGANVIRVIEQALKSSKENRTIEF
jgi:hypothetical protein